MSKNTLKMKDASWGVKKGTKKKNSMSVDSFKLG